MSFRVSIADVAREAVADDILLASLVTPALTTLRVDRQAVGAAALRMLLVQYQGASAFRTTLAFHPELIVCASAP